MMATKVCHNACLIMKLMVSYCFGFCLIRAVILSDPHRKASILVFWLKSSSRFGFFRILLLASEIFLATDILATGVPHLPYITQISALCLDCSCFREASNFFRHAARPGWRPCLMPCSFSSSARVFFQLFVEFKTLESIFNM